MIECYVITNLLHGGRIFEAGATAMLPLDVYEHLRAQGCVETMAERSVRASASERVAAIHADAEAAADLARADALAGAELEAEEARAQSEQTAARAAAELEASSKPETKRSRKG